MNNIFPSNITPEETEAGLVQQTAKNGYGSITGADEQITIVVKPLSGNRRFIKFDDSYGLQQLTEPDAPEQLDSWEPIEDAISTLNDVREAT